MSVSSSIFIGVLGKGLTAAVALAGTMIVSRVLTPSEFGAFAVAMAVTGFLTALRNFGTSNYLVQARAVDRQVVGSAFAATGAISWSLGAAIFVYRADVARFFDAPQISAIMAVLALNFAISPFVMTATALVMRAQRFPELIRSEVVAGVLGIVVGVLLCVLGVGAISLAWGMTVQSVSLLWLLLLARPDGLTFIPSIKHARRVLHFGGWASGVTLLNQASNRLPELVLGRTADVSVAALYDRGAGLSRLIWDQVYAEVVRILLPAFAVEHRQNPQDATHYLRRVAFLTSVLTPMFLFLAVFAEQAILVLYGEQWTNAVGVSVLIALSGALIAPFVICEQLLIGTGAISRVFALKVIQAAVLAVGLVLVPWFGLDAAGFAVLLSSISYAITSQWITLRSLGCDAKSFAAAVERPLVVVLATYCGILLGYAWLESSLKQQPVMHLLAGGSIAAIAWLFTVKLMNLPAYEVVTRGIVLLWRLGHQPWLKWKGASGNPS
jgi:O-antigen/teichoic acid export membrane protein